MSKAHSGEADTKRLEELEKKEEMLEARRLIKIEKEAMRFGEEVEQLLSKIDRLNDEVNSPDKSLIETRALYDSAVELRKEAIALKDAGTRLSRRAIPLYGTLWAREKIGNKTVMVGRTSSELWEGSIHILGHRLARMGG